MSNGHCRTGAIVELQEKGKKLRIHLSGYYSGGTVGSQLCRGQSKNSLQRLEVVSPLAFFPVFCVLYLSRAFKSMT